MKCKYIKKFVFKDGNKIETKYTVVFKNKFKIKIKKIIDEQNKIIFVVEHGKISNNNENIQGRWIGYGNSLSLALNMIYDLIIYDYLNKDSYFHNHIAKLVKKIIIERC